MLTLLSFLINSCESYISSIDDVFELNCFLEGLEFGSRRPEPLVSWARWSVAGLSRAVVPPVISYF
jgi:hypothetical protein